ncbi:SatD family (SatD) [Tenacibaculum mesophilum]|uniref:Transcriptional regulator n=1 Tax=Tenacibaculum mesophilum TaxID=104268 RepID=A0ABN5T2I8_9FLAO|nr:SatD family protein [Tenacibaculum mesophilum]AZJ31423.1 transcriptional regulator [Tenacibaculum mesophilum]QFS29470.1 transcriptional regulator [Tenacibaculum mesophilum]SHF96122.1 SatD family (SatD) [Tenacibaculum mesophilum]
MTSVITGDIINSRGVSAETWLPVMKESFNTIGKTPKTWELFRGDSFQIEIENIAEALLFTFKLKSTIKKIKDLDIRLAIGIGNKNFDTEKITEANGEAFINSGYAFDYLLKKQNLALKTPWEDINDEFEVSISLSLLIMDNWTTNSAAFVNMSLQNPESTQKIIAKKLAISESSASERRKRSGFDEIMKLEKRYRKLMNQKLTKI